MRVRVHFYPMDLTIPDPPEQGDDFDKEAYIEECVNSELFMQAPEIEFIEDR